MNPDDPIFTEKITVNKLDVARRQLATAINLWFNDGDPISTHALAYAAHEIIHFLFRRKGLSDLMFDSSAIKDQHRSDFAKMIKEDANFFKHANNDPDGIHEFVCGRNLLFILMATTGLNKMGEKLNDEESIFFFWCRVHFPHWFQLGKDAIPEDVMRELTSVTRREFFEGSMAHRREFKSVI